MHHDVHLWEIFLQNWNWLFFIFVSVFLIGGTRS